MFFSFLGLTTSLQAQNDAKQDEEKKQLQERVINAKRQKALRERSVQTQTSKYNHKEAEILAKLNTEIIPEDFPAYKNEYSDEQYLILMNKWYASHPASLKNSTTPNETK